MQSDVSESKYHGTEIALRAAQSSNQTMIATKDKYNTF